MNEIAYVIKYEEAKLDVRREYSKIKSRDPNRALRFPILVRGIYSRNMRTQRGIHPRTMLSLLIR